MAEKLLVEFIRQVDELGKEYTDDEYESRVQNLAHDGYYSMLFNNYDTDDDWR